MNIKAFYCPHCGGNIKFDIDSGKKSCFCIHCGQQIILDDEVVRTEHTERYIDYARIEEAKIKLEMQKHSSRTTFIGVFLFIGLLIFFIIMLIVLNQIEF